MIDFHSERDLVERFLEQMFNVFPQMTVAACEVPGIDGIADLVLARPRSSDEYARFRNAYHACTDVLCETHVTINGGQTEPPQQLFANVVAIEAKLKDWKAGLYQATRYRQFAHRCYVLLAGSALENALNMSSLFRKAHIGIIGFRRSSFRVYVSSPWMQPAYPMGKRFFYPRGENTHFLRLNAFEPLTPCGEMSECSGSRSDIFGPPFSVLDPA